ncbi:MAG: tetratricopeptide repeat protein [Pyrinomonadaceae bacterium]
MITHNKITASLLALILLLLPFTSAYNSYAAARFAQQQETDVPSDAEQAMFTKGQNFYLQGHYEQAVTTLRDFLKNYPRSIITDLTLLWLGRSYMQLGRLQDAEQVGQRLHAMKDTPFAEIYDGELQSARQQTAAAKPSPTPATADTKSNQTVAVSKPPVVKPSPTPTPRAPQKVDTVATKKPPVNNKTESVAATKLQSDQAARNNKPVTTTQTPPAQKVVQIEPSRTPAGRRRAPRRNPNAETAAAQTNSNTNQTPRTTEPPANTEVAVNNPPRNIPVNTNTPVATMTPATTRTVPPRVETPSTEAAPLTQGSGLSITVKQVPNLVLSLHRASESASPGQVVQLPLTVKNTGNKEDQFRLETDLPADFQPSFSLATGGSDTQLPILVTPQLARDASVDVMLNLRVPETATDGMQRRFIVNAASQSDYQIQRVAEGSISVIAAALSAVTNSSQTSVMPGETFTQTINVRNQGSASAKSSRADFVFNPQFELVSASPSPLVYDRPSRTAIWNLGDLGTRDGREIKVTLRAVPEALAITNSLGRGTLRTQSLPVGANFDSPSVSIGKVPKARIDAVSVGLTATPGDTINIPFVVRNPGNAPDSYELRITAPGAPAATIYADTNGDGQLQDGEPAITQTGQLTPQGGQYPLLLRVQIPASTADRQQYSYNLVARSQTSGAQASEASTVLTVAAPRVRVRTEQVSSDSAPGDTIFYRLVLVNDGSGLAKNLVVSETLPDALQFINSEPSLNPQDAPGDTQRFVWRVSELAPGDTAVLRIAVRLRQNLSADVNLTSRHTLTYQDTNSNNYQGQ